MLAEIWFNGKQKIESALFRSSFQCQWAFINKDMYKVNQKNGLVQKKENVTWYTENCYNAKQCFQSDRLHKSNGDLMGVTASSKEECTLYKIYTVGQKGRATGRKMQKEVLNR